MTNPISPQAARAPRASRATVLAMPGETDVRVVENPEAKRFEAYLGEHPEYDDVVDHTTPH